MCEFPARKKQKATIHIELRKPDDPDWLARLLWELRRRGDDPRMKVRV